MPPFLRFLDRAKLGFCLFSLRLASHRAECLQPVAQQRQIVGGEDERPVIHHKRFFIAPSLTEQRALVPEDPFILRPVPRWRLSERFERCLLVAHPQLDHAEFIPGIGPPGEHLHAALGQGQGFSRASLLAQPAAGRARSAELIV